MFTYWALVFISVNFLQNSTDVAVMNAVKDPYLSASLEQCQGKREAIMAQTNEKNLSAFCVPVTKY